MAALKQTYSVPVIFMLLLVFLMVYLIMVSPSERANLLQPDETLGAKTNVAIESNSFIPSSVKIKVGDSVAWTNNDLTKHRISGADFKSGILNHGDTYARKFDEQGVYVYSCEFYPGAVGQIIVE